jgi:phosphate starvation-inducible PhoH-like protein
MSSKSGDWRELRDGALEDMRRERERLKPKTEGQARYIRAIETSTVTVCTGPAGSGKTLCAVGVAAQMLREKRISKLILTRPLLTCGTGVGFLPGNVDEKVQPYMRPLLDALQTFFSGAEIEKLMQNRVIEMVPLELMRGMSIKHAVVICDEAQNAEFTQLHMLLTRFDEGTRIIVAGDDRQSDLRTGGPNPLMLVLRRLAPDRHPDVAVVRLTKDDVVRHPLVAWVDERLSAAAREQEVPWGVWRPARCPGCDATNWFNNGDEDDPEGADVEAVGCHNCGKAFSVGWEGERPKVLENTTNAARGQRRPE